MAPKKQEPPANISPRIYVTLFLALCVVRCFSAFVQPIADCDEVYNYWEPTHLILYKERSFQTWEYSPEFALRSYLYVLIHVAIGKMFTFLFSTKIAVFYFIRASLGVLSAICEVIFIRGTDKVFGNRIAFLTFFFLLIGSGMFNAGASYLPSTFTMYFLMVGAGFWMSASSENVSSPQKSKSLFALALFGTGIAGIIGWPFCIVAVLPLGFDILIQYGFFSFLKTSIFVVASLIGSNIACDYYFYKKIIFTPLNLLMYNRGSGSQLYGVEPWTFYFKNLFLNFNIVFPLGLISILVILIHTIAVKKVRAIPVLRQIAFILPFYIWFAFMTSVPHKEERFLYLIYPFLCLAAAITWEYSLEIIRLPKSVILSLLLVLAFTLLSVSRSYSVVKNYGAPLQTYTALYKELETYGNTNTNICVGKEWYRYPSSFFIPQGNYQFIKSEFNGLLPKPFDLSKGLIHATSSIPTNLNNQNREEPSLYVDVASCDYLVDFDFEEQKEERYTQSSLWKPIFESKFLDADKSPSLTRAFYIPFESDKKNVYGKYVILKKVK